LRIAVDLLNTIFYSISPAETPAKPSSQQLCEHAGSQYDIRAGIQVYRQDKSQSASCMENLGKTRNAQSFCSSSISQNNSPCGLEEHSLGTCLDS
jgi:hypothetical protein